MKNFKALLAAMCAAGIMAGSAWAGNIDSESAFDGLTPITVAAEGGTVLTLNDYDLDSDVASPLGNAALGMAILYEPLVSFNAGDTIRFTLSNGTFEDATLFMAVDEDDIDGAGTANDLDAGVATEYQIVGQESDRAADDTWVEMTVVAVGGSTWQPTWEIALISSNADADGGGDPAVELDATAYDHNIRIRPIATTADVTIAVTDATYSGGNAAAQTILDINTQFAFALTTAGTSVIDVAVASARTNFVEEGGVGDVLTSANDTDLTAAGALITYTSAALNDAITLVAADIITLTLSSTSFDGLNFAGSMVFYEVGNAQADDADVDFTDNANLTATATIPGNTVNFVTPGNTNADDLYLGVDGTTVLTPRTFDLAVGLDFTTAGYADATWSLTGASTWTINGAQFVAPHMVSRGTYDSYLVVKSVAGSAAATVTIDLLNRAGETAQIIRTLEAATAGGSLFISASSLLADAATAAWTATGIDTDFSAALTITLAESSVYVEGFKYNSESTDMNVMTVYDGTTTRGGMVK